MDVLTSQEPEIPPPQRYMDSHGADFLDPRAGAVRAVTRGRVVSINVPLVQTSRFNNFGISKWGTSNFEYYEFGGNT